MENNNNRILQASSEEDFQELTKVAEYIDNVCDELETIDTLKKIILESDEKYSISAPQIGASKQIFVIALDKEKINIEAYINPEIVKFYQNKVSYFKETCLSEGDKTFAIKRFKMLKVRYTNENGKRVKKLLRGFEAVAFQHEFDHLYGILPNMKSISQDLINDINKEYSKDNKDSKDNKEGKDNE